jgi:hypothetical protein
MEYFVFSSGYTSRKLAKKKGRWNYEELKNLTRTLNEFAKDRWKVSQIIPILQDSGVLYTVLLKRD